MAEIQFTPVYLLTTLETYVSQKSCTFPRIEANTFLSFYDSGAMIKRMTEENIVGGMVINLLVVLN